MDSRATIDHTAETADQPVSIAHLMHTLRRYMPVIVLTLLSVAIIYILGVVAYMVAKPSQTATMLRFRLNFTGADKGIYPNGAAFNASTMISTPVLRKVYQANELGRFQPFDRFAQSIIVLESNTALERLNADYQARLADPKLTPVDRDRIFREFDAKRESLGKNEFALTYARVQGSVPENLVRKVLSDILVTWANDAEKTQRLFDYPLAILSPDILTVTSADKNDPMISLLVLRLNISRLLKNVVEMEHVPGATLIRTPSKKMSLIELRMRLDDTLRFRVEPLLAEIRNGGLIRNPAVMVQFLENQLTYDELRLKELQQRGEAIRTALTVYTNSGPNAVEQGTMVTQGTQPKSAETVTPMVNDSFLDRLVAMSNQADEIKYRQKIADDYQRATLDVIPTQQAVEYDKEMLDLMRHAPAASQQLPAAQVTADVEQIREESRGLAAQLSEIDQILSRTINPSSQIYSVTEAPTTTIQRSGDIRRSFLGLVLALLVTLPITVIACLLHNRVREEDEAEEELLEATT
ncbi:MAG TPA: hypothetical protein VII75_02545 [Thermoanaerobaculia bacterium]|nr:hypothetical protein [Thermoanaerobaculia bacterium]